MRSKKTKKRITLSLTINYPLQFQLSMESSYKGLWAETSTCPGDRGGVVTGGGETGTGNTVTATTVVDKGGEVGVQAFDRGGIGGGVS